MSHTLKLILDLGEPCVVTLFSREGQLLTSHEGHWSLSNTLLQSASMKELGAGGETQAPRDPERPFTPAWRKSSSPFSAWVGHFHGRRISWHIKRFVCKAIYPKFKLPPLISWYLISICLVPISSILNESESREEKKGYLVSVLSPKPWYTDLEPWEMVTGHGLMGPFG